SRAIGAAQRWPIVTVWWCSRDINCSHRDTSLARNMVRDCDHICETKRTARTHTCGHIGGLASVRRLRYTLIKFLLLLHSLILLWLQHHFAKLQAERESGNESGEKAAKREH